MKKLLFLLSLFFLSSSLFSQTENYWIKKTDFGGLKRERAVAFTINGKGYVGTGVDTAEAVRKDFWAYDPITNAWTQIADFGGVARRNAIAFSANNQGYVGTGMSAAVSSMGTTLADIWSYNPLTNIWTQKSSYPGNLGLGIYFATAFSVNNKGYICGGKKGPANYSDELWEYKPSTDTWSMLQAFPGGVRYQLTSFVVDNKAYVGLGVDLDVFRKDIWEFDPSTNLWTQKSDFLGSERGAVSTFAFNYRGFICLGGDGGYKKDVWEYNPYNDSWSIRADFGGSARKNAFSFVINDTAYVGCGKGISGKKMSFYAYVPYHSALSVNNFKYIELSVYPNPINDILTLKFNTPNIHSIAIYDMMGKEVYAQIINTTQLSIKRTNINPGTYLLVARNTFGQPLTSKKLIFK